MQAAADLAQFDHALQRAQAQGQVFDGVRTEAGAVHAQCGAGIDGADRVQGQGFVAAGCGRLAPGGVGGLRSCQHQQRRVQQVQVQVRVDLRALETRVAQRAVAAGGPQFQRQRHAGALAPQVRRPGECQGHGLGGGAADIHAQLFETQLVTVRGDGDLALGGDVQRRLAGHVQRQRQRNGCAVEVQPAGLQRAQFQHRGLAGLRVQALHAGVGDLKAGHVQRQRHRQGRLRTRRLSGGLALAAALGIPGFQFRVAVAAGVHALRRRRGHQARGQVAHADGVDLDLAREQWQ